MPRGVDPEVTLAINRASSDDYGVDQVDEEDDDGWGAAAKGVSFDEKTKELQELQNNRKNASSRNQSAPEEGERDLFIPIFAIVSLLGLFGSYGYEMMRLASRGELYLPWNNN